MQSREIRSFARRGRKNLTAWVFLMPLVVYFIIFQLAPIVLSFLISLTDWNGISDFDMADMWVGFDNYIEAMTNSILYPDFWPSFGTTFLYVLLTVPASMWPGQRTMNGIRMPPS